MVSKRQGVKPGKKESLKAEPKQVQTLVLPANFEISPEMQAAINATSEEKSIFITGRAGTGKSTLLTYPREEVLHDNYVVVAPTGVAAINVGGSTIHKFFGFLPDITFQHTPGYLARQRLCEITERLHFLTQRAPFV
jgi:Cdc6-like AAA superfamily ATPase